MGALFFDPFAVRCDNYARLPGGCAQCTHMDNPGAKCCQEDCPRWIIGERGQKTTENQKGLDLSNPPRGGCFDAGQRYGKTAKLVQEIKAEALREAVAAIEADRDARVAEAKGHPELFDTPEHYGIVAGMNISVNVIGRMIKK